MATEEFFAVSPASLDSADKCAAFLQRAYEHIRVYKELIEAHGSDITFLSSHSFELIPSSWGSGSLLELDLGQLTQLSLGKCPAHLPEEFKHFIRVSRSCQLDPDPKSDVEVPHCHVRHFLGTTDKKRFEMLNMARAIGQVAERTSTQHVVDIGCGKGYLSTLLASAYKLSVLGIEQSPETAAAAKERNELVRKKLPKEDANFNVKVRAARIRLGNEMEADSVTLNSILDEEAVDSTILVGLHICGDLLPDCLQLFSSCSHLRAAVLCGCCYNMLTEASECDPTISQSRFPLSTFARAHNITFGRRLRNAACHSVCEWARDTPGLVERLTYTSCYRAVLGCFMQQHGLCTTRKWGRTFQNVKRKPAFGAWAAELLALHCSEVPPPLEAELEAYYQGIQALCLAQLTVFECVVGALLPVLESIIVVDRMLYCWEQGLAVQAEALFAPHQSPRTFVLTVRRP